MAQPATSTPRVPAVLTRTVHSAAQDGPRAVALSAAVGAVLLLAAVLVRSRRRRSLAHGGRVIEISAPPAVEPKAGEALWANLLGLHRPNWRRLVHGQEHVAFELAADAEGLRIRVWIPGSVTPGMLEHAVESAWPGARAMLLEHVPAPIPAGPAVRIEAGRLIPGRNGIVPLRTGFDTDPLRALLGVFGALGHGEAGCLQVLARPASAYRARRLRRSLTQLAGRGGRGIPSLGRVLAGFVPDPAPKRGGYSSQRPRDPRSDADARAAAGKLSGPLWETEVRYAAAVTPQKKAAPGSARGRCRGIAGEIASAMNTFAERNYLRRRRLPRPSHLIGSRMFTRGALYSIPEIAALAHLPFDAVVPGLARAGARPVPPVVRIPAAGSAQAPAVVLGDADAGPARTLALPVADARHHLHVIGATGSGKSTLLASLVLQDIDAHRGTVVIDPNGDLVENILARLPAEAVERTVLLDPELDAPPPRINPFDGAEPAAAVDNLTSIFARIYQGFWGPRSDDLLRAACLTLITAHRNDPGRSTPTLAQIPPLLTSDSYRRRILHGLEPAGGDIGETAVLAGFWAWFEQLSAPSRAHTTAPLLNKMRAFLLRDFAAASVATGSTSIDLDAVLDGGICLVRLPKGVLGVETVRLLGSFVVAKFWQAATSRTRLGTERRDAAITVDECHNFLNLAIPPEEMLAEARAYRYCQRLAHQNLSQLPSGLREGLSANARNKVIFNVSPEDAHQLERHSLPELGAHDLANLGAFQAVARVTVGSEEQPAATLRTRPLPEVDAGRAAQVRALIAARSVADENSEEEEE